LPARSTAAASTARQWTGTSNAPLNSSAPHTKKRTGQTFFIEDD
jgi:hypothetical protein